MRARLARVADCRRTGVGCCADVLGRSFQPSLTLGGVSLDHHLPLPLFPSPHTMTTADALKSHLKTATLPASGRVYEYLDVPAAAAAKGTLVLLHGWPDSW